jgi:hypothetical protein
MPRWGQVASNSVQTLWASELNNGRECQTKACLWVSIGHSVGSNYGYGSGIIFSKRACACLKMGGISPQRASLMGEKVDNPLGFWSSPLNSQGTQIPMVNGSALSWTLWTIPGASGACGSCGCPESRGLKGGWSQVARYSKPNHAVPKKWRGIDDQMLLRKSTWVNLRKRQLTVDLLRQELRKIPFVCRSFLLRWKGCFCAVHRDRSRWHGALRSCASK